MSLSFLKKMFSLLTVFALSGCSGADLLNLTIPRSGYVLHKDIAYGTEPRQMMDIYVPDRITADTCVMVFFYGGSWQGGSKDIYRFVGQAFTSKNCITVIPDYRVYPDVSYPVFLEDSAKAVTWVHDNIAKYGALTKDIYLSGHSAGAYNAMMLTLRPELLAAADGKISWIKGTIGIAGPYNFLPFTDPNIIKLFSTEKDKATQPINYVHTGVVPIMLATGDADTEVDPRNSHTLADKLKAQGNNVTEYSYKGIGHVGMALSLARGFRYRAPLLNDIEAFIKAND